MIVLVLYCYLRLLVFLLFLMVWLWFAYRLWVLAGFDLGLCWVVWVLQTCGFAELIVLCLVWMVLIWVVCWFLICLLWVLVVCWGLADSFWELDVWVIGMGLLWCLYNLLWVWYCVSLCFVICYISWCYTCVWLFSCCCQSLDCLICYIVLMMLVDFFGLLFWGWTLICVACFILLILYWFVFNCFCSCVNFCFVLCVTSLRWLFWDLILFVLF